ncbi:MAG: DUF7344 domain-containing protein [Halobacteriota archaeon]
MNPLQTHNPTTTHPTWDEDQPYQLLANARRRECVRYVTSMEDNEAVSVRELADSVADSLDNNPPASNDFRQSVYISLTQRHLEKLDGCDVISYDPEDKLVRVGPNLESIRPMTRVDETQSNDRLNVLTLVISLLTCIALVVGGLAYPSLPAVGLLTLLGLNLVSVGVFVQQRLDH